MTALNGRRAAQGADTIVVVGRVHAYRHGLAVALRELGFPVDERAQVLPGASHGDRAVLVAVHDEADWIALERRCAEEPGPRVGVV